MRGIRRFEGLLFFIFLIISSLFTNYQINNMEIKYPENTKYAIWSDFSSVNIPKDEIVNNISAIAGKKDEILFLNKSLGSDSSLLDLVVFGDNHYGDTEKNIQWFSLTRRGEYINPSNINDLSLSGNYSFYSNALANDFISYVESIGGKCTEISNRNDAFIVTVSRSPGFMLSVLTIGLAVLAISWTQASMVVKSREFSLISGVSVFISFFDEFLLSIKNSLAISTIGGLSIFLEENIRHNWISFSTFSSIYWLLIASFLGFSIFSHFICLVVLSPRVRNIRKNVSFYTSVRNVNSILLSFSTALTIISIAMSITFTVQSRRNVTDAETWSHVPEIVSLQMGNVDNEYINSQKDQIESFFEELDDSKDLILSYSVAPSFIKTDDMFLSQSQIAAELSPYDNVIICNQTFLKSLNIQTNSLKKIYYSDIPKSIYDTITIYDDIWIADDKTLLEENLYEWTDKNQRFPSLSYATGDGSLDNSKNPLIILLDKPSTQLTIIGFLLPALSTGNLVFTNERIVNEKIKKYNISKLIVSSSTIFDVVSTKIMWYRSTLIFSYLSTIMSLCAAIILGYESSRLWAIYNADRIFTMHSNGISYENIARNSMIIDSLFMLGGGGVALLIILSGIIFTSELSGIISAIILIAFIIFFVCLIRLFLSRFTFKRTIFRRLNE